MPKHQEIKAQKNTLRKEQKSSYINLYLKAFVKNTTPEENRFTQAQHQKNKLLILHIIPSIIEQHA